MDLLQIGITVALSTVANQAGRPLVVAGYNQFSKKIVGFWSSQSEQQLTLNNGDMPYRILLLPVSVPLDMEPITLADLSMIQLTVEAQRQLQMMADACSSHEPLDTLLTEEDRMNQLLCHFSESFSSSKYNLSLPNGDCDFQMRSCSENQGQILPMKAISVGLSETLSLLQY